MNRSILPFVAITAAGLVGASFVLPACADDTELGVAPAEEAGSEAGPDVVTPTVDSGNDATKPDAGPLVCRATEVKCADGTCANLREDPKNCGACGTVCTGASPFCSLGQCTAGCAAGLLECNKACVDKTSDPNNCGACGTK